MNNLHAYMDQWKQSKVNVFTIEKLTVDIFEDFESDTVSRCLELEQKGLLAKATQYEDGFLELSVVDKNSKEVLLESSGNIVEEWELEERLNTWLSEVLLNISKS